MSIAAAVPLAAHQRLGEWKQIADVFLVLSRFSERMFGQAGIEPSWMVHHNQVVADPGVRRLPPSQSQTYLYVGRMVEEKGVNIVVESWRRASVDGRLLMVGDGPLLAQLKRTGSRSIEFLGALPREEVGALMQRSRALLIPSLCYEQQPTVAAEARAAGLPFVASDHGGLRELTRRGGFAAKPGSVEAWAAAIRAIANGEVAVDSAGRAGRVAYSRYHSSDAVYESLMRGYEMAKGRSEDSFR